MTDVLKKAIDKVESESCTACGLCCFIQLVVKVEGKKFVPCAFTVDKAEENEQRYLSLQVCESFDQKTRKCGDYDNRPEACKTYNCKGKPHPQILSIAGKQESKIIKPGG